jgi:hypothetical protein
MNALYPARHSLIPAVNTEAFWIWTQKAAEERALLDRLIAAGDRDAIGYDKWERSRIRRNATARARYAAKKAMGDVVLAVARFNCAVEKGKAALAHAHYVLNKAKA